MNQAENSGFKKSRGSFTGNLGFILAAAGSAVGLGNLWRFPYLAAKDGGGLFVLIYVILSLTFGFSLLATEIAIGRKTQSAPLVAYKKIHPKFGFLGWIATLVPIIIFPYYCVIGGWVTKYAATYITDKASDIYTAGASEFFTGYITANVEPIVWFLVFMGLSAIVVVLGVEKGIENASKILMPSLLILVVAIAVYALTLKDEASGRTALEGLKVYLIPDFTGITASKIFTILLDAIGQMFYSLSIAMGIMITYGSYVKKEDNLVKSVNRIEIFDTGVALIAGMIVIPSVFVFKGQEGLGASGPSLMFISLPQVFERMGKVGTVIGALFFVLVLFAALTSSISLLEAVASCLIDYFRMKRPLATLIAFLISLAIGLVVCFGYNIWYMELTLPNGAAGQQILDVLDYVSNSLMLPIVALITCVLIGWFAKPKCVIEELEIGLNGQKFRRRGLINVMLRYVAPVLLVVILLQAFNVFAFLG